MRISNFFNGFFSTSAYLVALILIDLALFYNPFFPHLYNDMGITINLLDYPFQMALTVLVAGIIGLILGKMDKGYFFISFVSPIIAATIVVVLVYF